MDSVTLVDNQVEDGWRLLDRLKSQGFAVRAACWVKPADEDRYSLYIATRTIEQKGPAESYREVIPIVRSLSDIGISSSDIKLIGETHPIAKQLVMLHRNSPGRTTYRDISLAGIAAEELYLYPTNWVAVPVYGLVYRGAPDQTLHLSFEPQNPHSWLEVESGGRLNRYPAEVGMDWEVAAPDGAALERNEIGLKVLAWELDRKRIRSTANTIFDLAKLGLRGFRFLREPA